VPVTTRIGVDPELTAKLPKWFNGVVVKPAAVLYEDKYVQIGVRSTFTGAEGKVTLFIGCKCEVPLVGLKVRVPEVPVLKATVGEFATTVAPRTQSQVPITLESLQPCPDPIALQVSFISAPGTGHAYPLRLPVTVHNFCEPAAMSGDDFKARWGALAGAPREATSAITPSNPATITTETARAALAMLKMAPLDVPGAPGVPGASSFRTHSLNAAGAHLSVGCLAMVIPSAATGAFKVAVRTQHQDVTRGLLAQLTAILSGDSV